MAALIGLPALLALVFSVWAFADCAVNQQIEDAHKLICLILIILTGPVGGLISCMVYRGG